MLWQVVKGLLALKNEHEVQLDCHDTLWGETGTCFSSITVHHAAPMFPAAAAAAGMLPAAH